MTDTLNFDEGRGRSHLTRHLRNIAKARLILSLALSICGWRHVEVLTALHVGCYLHIPFCHASDTVRILTSSDRTICLVPLLLCSVVPCRLSSMAESLEVPAPRPPAWRRRLTVDLGPAAQPRQELRQLTLFDTREPVLRWRQHGEDTQLESRSTLSRTTANTHPPHRINGSARSRPKSRPKPRSAPSSTRRTRRAPKMSWTRTTGSASVKKMASLRRSREWSLNGRERACPSRG